EGSLITSQSGSCGTSRRSGQDARRAADRRDNETAEALAECVRISDCRRCPPARASTGLEPVHSLGGRPHSQHPPMRACFSSCRSRSVDFSDPLAIPGLEVPCALTWTLMSLMRYLLCTPRGGERAQSPDDYGV